MLLKFLDFPTHVVGKYIPLYLVLDRKHVHHEEILKHSFASENRSSALVGNFNMNFLQRFLLSVLLLAHFLKCEA